jgi:hypothetical protein
MKVAQRTLRREEMSAKREVLESARVRGVPVVVSGTWHGDFTGMVKEVHRTIAVIDLDGELLEIPYSCSCVQFTEKK